MNEPDQRRKVSLAGLGLISAGAVLGLALAGPATSREETAAAPTTATRIDPQPPATPS